MARRYHQINVSGAEVTRNETGVLVYDSAEYSSFSNAYRNSHGNLNTWDSNLLSSPHKAKFFSLLPFQWESNWSPKSFVLRLELFP